MMVKTIEKTVELSKLHSNKTVELPKLDPPATYPSDSRDLIAPDNYEERMEWIRSSFESFFRQIKERESLLDFEKQLGSNSRESHTDRFWVK